jgi:hypothetical protein
MNDPFEAIRTAFASAVVKFVAQSIEDASSKVPSYRFEVKAVQPRRKKGQVAQWKREGHAFR